MTMPVASPIRTWIGCPSGVENPSTARTISVAARTAGAFRIDLVRNGIAKVRFNAIPYEPGNFATIARDGYTTAIPILPDDLHHVLGIEPLPECRRPFQIDEHDGQRSPLT
jgi:hypothetical protein